MKFVLLAVVAGLAVDTVITQPQDDGVDCTALADVGNCDFYTKCAEAKFHCGPNGYPVGFGYKYCTKFGEEIDCFTDDGKEWVNNVRVCLTKDLDDSSVYASNTTTCEELKTFAFHTHPKCYVDNGFCTKILLSLKNLICLWKVFDISDFFNKLAIEQVFETLLMCAEGERNSYLSNVEDWIQSAKVHQGLKDFMKESSAKLKKRSQTEL